jgi:hypothetical protein
MFICPAVKRNHFFCHKYVHSEPAVLTLALAAPVIDGHDSNPELRVQGLHSLLKTVCEGKKDCHRLKILRLSVIC